MKRNRAKRGWQFYTITAALIVALFFGVFIGFQAIRAQLGKGAPVVGNRFDNDLDPKIKQESLDKILTDIKAVNGVKDAKINLATATVRVYAEMDVNREKALQANLENLYDLVIEELDVKEYFTIKGMQKQYDLEIHGYNQLPTEENKDSYLYAVLVKNSNMDEPEVQVLTKPKSQDVVDFFYAEEKRRDEEEALKNAPQTQEPETQEGDKIGGE